MKWWVPLLVLKSLLLRQEDEALLSQVEVEESHQNLLEVEEWVFQQAYLI
jgi:hypothetical protein